MPVLAQAGIAIGGLSPVLMASTAGVTAFAAALAGSLIVALEKAGDEVKDLTARFAAFGGDGGRTFGQLQEAAKELRVSTGALAKPFEAVLRAAPQGVDIQKAVETIVKSTQAERVPQEKALAAITEFFKKLDRGPIGEAEFKALEDIAPETAKAIQKNLPVQAQVTGIISKADVFGALDQMGAGDAGAKLDAAAKAATGIAISWGHLKAAIDRLLEAGAGGDTVSSAFEAAAKAVNDIADGITKLRKDLDEKFKKAQAAGSDRVVDLGPLLTVDVQKKSPFQQQVAEQLGLTDEELKRNLGFRAAGAGPFDKFQPPPPPPIPDLKSDAARKELNELARIHRQAW